MAKASEDIGVAQLLLKMDVLINVTIIKHMMVANVSLTVENLLKDTIIFHGSSWMIERINVLVLFEEFGGTPDDVTVQTVTVGTVCAHAYDDNNMQQSCQGGRVFADIRFASFGDPEGICGPFKRGTCE
ncbi:hypothetical protein Ddye_008039 [Dipteronia dyeriana]|uniref:Uncharacterized protein n=1 Tax=Dipteronia dyeriana TaxID=168575 RepID=A0AAE0CKY0_9ROSI|nr:hypothetical protein Ddye_008039 [Dipteronia dyeriana]